MPRNSHSSWVPYAGLVIICSLLAFWLGVYVQNIDLSLATPASSSKDGVVIEETQEALDHLPGKDEISFHQLWAVWTILRKGMYVEEDVTAQDVSYGMIKGMVNSVGDRYTSFLDPEQADEFKIDVDGELTGIGAEIGKQNDYYYIVKVLKGAPAFKSGLRADDVIISLDGEKASELKFRDLIDNIRGEKGTVVSLEISRMNTDSALLTFDITRDDIKVPAVEYEMLDNQIAHITLNSFTPRIAAELKETLEPLQNQSVQGVIIDMRDNPGGYLDQAIQVLSMLIPQGTAVQKRFADKKIERVPLKGKVVIAKDTPIVVLVNEYSASASEIVAGTLQDYNRAHLIGQTTVGKGSIQDVKTLPDGSTLKYTYARWLTGQGNDIHEIGIEPDQFVEQIEEEIGEEKIDEQLEAAVEKILGL